MKRVFIAFMYAPKQTGKAGGNQSTTPQSNVANENKGGDEKGADEPAPAAPVVNEPTSEKLTAIQSEINNLMDVVLPAETDRKKKLDIIMNIQKLQAEEKAEQNSIKKAALDAQIAEKRNARIALVDAVIDAVIAEQNYFRGEYAAAPRDEQGKVAQDVLDKMNGLTDAVKAAREKVANELVAKFTTSASASTGTKESTGTKGETSKKIIEMWEANRATGMSDTDNVKAIIAAGHSRGTTGAVTLAWRREHGEA